jgi:peptide/nickel transport system substrate-binding protein
MPAFVTPRNSNPRDDHPFGSGITRRQFVIGAVGLAAAGGLAACGGGGGDSGGTTGGSGGSGGSAGGTPKRGGDFRLGATGGDSKDVFDANYILSEPDQARLVSAFETLLTFDNDYQLQSDGLAESVTADNPLQYTIVLKKGIEFQNGKTLTADDVIYSFQRVADKSLALTLQGATETMDIKGLKAMDKYTVRLPMLTPDSTVPQTLAAYTFGITPVGYKRYPAPQIGTGPYKLKSFTPGQESVSERNPNYWRTGQPYFDTVTITDFSDSTAQVNALLGGQIDAMTDVPASQVAAVKAQGLGVLISKTGAWIPLCMAVDMAPFDDARVRQAMRLIVDREAMIEQIVSGYGTLANDLYSPFDEGYDHSLPQRTQDIDQAKSLLKAAGQDGMTVDLHTTNGANGMIGMATVFATQAKEAGVTVNVKNEPNFYSDNYLKVAFSGDYWGTRGYLSQVQQGSLPSSPYNETHWPPKSGDAANFTSLYQQALRATDAAKRVEIEHQMQKLEYDLGGYIIPFFRDLLDGYAAKVKGLSPSKGTQNLDSYGHGFRTIWFD